MASITSSEFGYADQMVLSHDYAAYIWIDRDVARRESPDWHWNLVPDVVLQFRP